jgi:hypothetical protein
MDGLGGIGELSLIATLILTRGVGTATLVNASRHEPGYLFPLVLL